MSSITSDKLQRIFWVNTKCIFSRPGRRQGVLYKHFWNSLCNSLTDVFSNPFPPTTLWCRHAQSVRDSSSSYKIDYVIIFKNYFLKLELHQNLVSGLEVTAILLKRWIWSIGGVASGRVCACSLRSRLVIQHKTQRKTKSETEKKLWYMYGRFILLVITKVISKI